MTDQLTDEAVKALLDRVPEFAGILRKQASLSRDLHLSSNLHNAADWMDYLARALLDARAENARLRADAQAAVALVLEQAAQLAEDGLLSVDGGLAAQEIRALALAPADGVAAVEALRKERDSLRQSLDACIPAVEEAAIKRGQAEAERDRLAAANAAQEAKLARLVGALKDRDMPDDWVPVIRECYARDGWTIDDLAEHFECSTQYIKKIVSGQVRARLGGPITRAALAAAMKGERG